MASVGLFFKRCPTLSLLPGDLDGSSVDTSILSADGFSLEVDVGGHVTTAGDQGAVFREEGDHRK